MQDHLRPKTARFRARPVLPICQRCKLHKTRCDRATPKCAACTKVNTPCLITDPLSKEEYSRDYIHSLEEKERRLLAKIRRCKVASATAPENTNLDSPTPRPPISQLSLPPVPPATRNRDSNGLGFFRSLISSTEPPLNPAPGASARHEQTLTQGLGPNSLPPSEEATKLIDNFFDRFHIHHTFLLRGDVLDTFQRIYSHGTPSKATPVDYFRIFMIFAVSAISRYRAGLSLEHPYGYYLAAQRFLNQVPLIGSIAAIENLLLVARFGMYHRCGVSLWEISQLCMRQCIEWGLHEPPSTQLDLLQEQRRRRIFWECYLLDRNSSGFLGRPFTISEAEIRVRLPVVADDEFIQRSAVSSLTEISDSPRSTAPTELSVFVYFIRLRRITSRIHLAFYAGARTCRHDQNTTATCFSSSDVYRKLNELLKELDNWRLDAPVFESPRSLYQRPDWYDFLWQRDRLSLIRGAIHNVPKRDKSPPKDLLAICLDAATRVIKLFFTMLRDNDITWTKGYLQAVFTAGLTIIYCMSLNAHTLASGITAEHPREALSFYGEMLRLFEEEMPDTGNFNFVFQAIRQKFLDHNSPSSGHLEIFGPMFSESGGQLCHAASREGLQNGTNAGEMRSSLARQNVNSGGYATSASVEDLGDTPFVSRAVPQPDGADADYNMDWFALPENVLQHLDTDLIYQAWAAPPSDLFGEWDNLNW